MQVELGVGYDLLLKMGYTGSGGLGKGESGRDRPVEVETRPAGQGLGPPDLLSRRACLGWSIDVYLHI